MNHDLINDGMTDVGFPWEGGATVDLARPAGASPLAEAVIGPANFKAIWWLELAAKSAKSICRVSLPTGSASGFLIAGNILMTNNHVFETKNEAASADLQFNFQFQADRSTLGPLDVYQTDPDDLFHTNPALDYTIVRVKAKNGAEAGDTWGYFDLRGGGGIAVNQRVNIIQHPQGRAKEIAFRDNQVKFIDDNKIQYLTDTDYGTSGSPVFNDKFQVVALHNQRVADPADPNRWYRNQGYRIPAILADAGTRIPG